VVAHCTIDGLRLGDWRYGACKSRSEEVAGQVFFRTRGGSFVDNVVTDTFNGIGADTSPDDSTVASACEIARCTFRHITDDAIELDSSHCLNLLVAADTIEDCGDGISIAPLWDGGPLFAFFNVIDRARYRGIKGGGGSVGLARFAHNTIVTAPTAVAAVDFSPGGAHDGTWFADNVLAGTGRAGAIRGPAEGGTETNAFDFDLLASGDERMLASWHRVSLTLGALRTSLGWERNGAVLDAAAAAAAARGLAASPALGVGCRLTGIDTGLDGNRYAGKAPSIGAIQQRAP
jgi:hypothetical protein